MKERRSVLVKYPLDLENSHLIHICVQYRYLLPSFKLEDSKYKKSLSSSDMVWAPFKAITSVIYCLYCAVDCGEISGSNFKIFFNDEKMEKVASKCTVRVKSVLALNQIWIENRSIWKQHLLSQAR